MHLDPARSHANQPYRVLCPQGRGYHDTTVQWCWPRPQCGGHVIAEDHEHATREAMAADGRCWSCRKSGPAQQSLL